MHQSMAEALQLIVGTAAAAVIAVLALRHRVSSTGVPGPTHRFSNPSVKDVLRVKQIIQQASKMPLELIDAVIDFAEYWPCSTVKASGGQYAIGSVVRFDHRDDMCNTLVLRSLPLGYHSEMAKGARPTKIERTSYQAADPLSPWQDLSSLESETPFVSDKWARYALPRGKNPCRKIVFTIHSSDQGWGGSTAHHGTYRGSYTWFDVGLAGSIAWNCNEFERSPRLDYSLLTILPQTITDKGCTMLDHPFLPPANRLQTNVLARSESTKHVITWSFDDDVKPDSLEGDELEEQGRGSASMTGEYVRSLKLGDVVTVWARARFPRWRNNVEEVRMDVFWAI